MPADSDVAPLCVTVTPFFARSRRRRTWTVSGSSRCIRLLHLLRDTDEPDLAPQPSAAQLPELVDVFRAAGLDVDLVLDGFDRRPARGRRPVGVPDRAGGPNQRPQACAGHGGPGRLPPRPDGVDLDLRSGRGGQNGPVGSPRRVGAWSACVSGSRSSVVTCTPRRPTTGDTSYEPAFPWSRPHEPVGRVVTTVVLADDQEMIRLGLRVMLEAGGVDVVAEAADGRAAVRACREHRPDVVLMDIRMPVLDGIAATAEVAASELPTRVLVLTTYDVDELVYRALRAGADGFLLKSTPADRLSTASGESRRAWPCCRLP